MISKPSLRTYVVTLILIIAMSCLILASIWSLHRANEAFSSANERAMSSASNQLKVQAIRIATNTGLASAFPDLSLWTQSPEAPGACLSFHNHLDDAVYHYCKGANHLSAAPSWFSWVYPKLFSLKSPAMQSIDYRDKSYGVLSLHPSHKEAITNAWTTLREVAIVSTVVILTTSLLMVFAMNIVIRPSRKI
ncbi:sensor histidine kinase [Methylophaga lonarensis MPL]|uniref:Sensor histidine kinase n=1 Tax=Methylophaga lonarensis MPL TaxID=1286106 RepID=M7NXA1_9GAMM|nr:hypothetical protein [Methylophaga lonarensis]EMR11922.1 sensor histidine kinase [Methylophaga lonarensis MPL]